MKMFSSPTHEDGNASSKATVSTLAVNTFGVFTSVPPVKRRPVSKGDAGGTDYPQRSRGSEFNPLAPHVPERLNAPRLYVARHHRWSRAPPLLKGIARHG